jgi:hypothetical protein
MRLIHRVVTIPAVLAACVMATGCFSYHKHVDETSSPAPVIEATPPSSTTVVTPPPAQSSSSTTTTTTTP